MNTNAAQRQIRLLISELDQIASRLENSKRISNLEIDHLKKKTIDLYDALGSLKPETPVYDRSEAELDFVTEPAEIQADEKSEYKPDNLQEVDTVKEENFTHNSDNLLADSSLLQPEEEDTEDDQPDITGNEMPSVETVEEKIIPRFVPEMPYEQPAGEEEQPFTEPDAEPALVKESEGIKIETVIPEMEQSEALEEVKEPLAAGNPSNTGANPEISIYERLSQTHQPVDLVEKLKAKPLSDIREGMSQSQKFQYIANLFDEDSELFNHTVNYINSARNLDEANDFIKINIEKKYKWTDENPLVAEFKNLVSRRFM